MKMKQEAVEKPFQGNKNNYEHDEKTSVRILLVETDKEIEQVAELAKEIWLEHYEPIIGREQVHYMIEKFQSVQAMKEQMEHKNYHYYRLMASDKLAGYFACCEEEEKLFLSKLYIAKNYRGMGYAREALNYMEDYCKNHDLQAIWLTVNRNNTGSIHRYEKLGFAKKYEQVADIGDGYVMDDYVMEKKL